jgi:hypothetical protein
MKGKIKMNHFTAHSQSRIASMKRHLLTLFVLFVVMCSNLFSQDNLFAKWEARTTATQARQPSWASPLVASYPMLVQNFRADFTRQITPALTPTWNYGASRGLNLVPGFNSEIDVYYPPYIQHNSKSKDGFGDVGFLYKYRFLSANENHGSYMLSAQVTATITTGSYSNGSTDASISPTLIGGKGFGNFDVISSMGGTLPTGDTRKLGRSIAWNTTAQYHLGKYLWPEVEANTTRYFQGSHDGKTQNFLTPGVATRKFKFHPGDERSRVGLAVGGGMQIATSEFHTYNHALVFTSRLVF